MSIPLVDAMDCVLSHHGKIRIYKRMLLIMNEIHESAFVPGKPQEREE